MNKKILLDTSFCIRLLNSDDEFHQQATDYYQHFLEAEYELYLSTIVVAEYAVKDDPNNLLSLNAFRILPFNFDDAKMAGEFLNILLKTEKKQNRQIVRNDYKLMAQIYNRKFDAYVTADTKSFNKLLQEVQQEVKRNVELIDFTVPLKQYLGKLF